jgi:hypothetical protein
MPTRFRTANLQNPPKSIGIRGFSAFHGEMEFITFGVPGLDKALNPG